jgi:hypothetical protein
MDKVRKPNISVKYEVIQHFKEFYLLGYNALQSIKSQPTFQTNVTSSG